MTLSASHYMCKVVDCCRQNSLNSWPVSHVVAAPLTSRHVTHVLLQPVASVVNPTPTVCQNGTAAEDIVITDQWRRSLVIDNNDPYVSMVSGASIGPTHTMLPVPQSYGSVAFYKLDYYFFRNLTHTNLTGSVV